MRAERHVGLLLEALDDVDGVARLDDSVGQARGAVGVEDRTVAGSALIFAAHASGSPKSVEPMSIANMPNVLAPKTIRWSSPYTALRWSSHSGPCLLQ